MYPYMTWETRDGTVYFYPYSVMEYQLDQNIMQGWTNG